MKTQIITLLCCCLTYIGVSQSITDAEYFFNTDPGFGNATAITVNANTGELNQTFLLPIGSSLNGFNTLYFRVKDNTNVWSLYTNNTFYVTEVSSGNGATSITSAEYFFNLDPGFGNATAIAINVNSGEITQTISIPVGNTLEGFNILYIRTQDDLGIWSLYEQKAFYIFPENASNNATSITNAEYFFNTDPGFGNGTALSTNTNTGTLNQVVSLPVGTLEGFNTLYVRTQDDLGVWSLYEKKVFYVRDDILISNITVAEYFYDVDPGFGNGTSATITPTANPEEYIIELATTDVTCDFHDFYIRLQNADDTWSLYDLGEDVEVFDNADPTIVVFPNIVAELDSNGQASITIADVNNGTFDDCELASVVLNQTQFDYTCANLGANTVTITATDAENKVSTQDVTITVEDNINPVAITQNITVQLDANGMATITPAQIDNNSTDNCTVSALSLDISNFTCANLGDNTITLTVTDQSNNTNTATAIVTIEDAINPVAVTQNITVQLDVNGMATITPAQIENGSTDNCVITNSSLDITSFTCANLGDNTINLTVTDASNNSNTEMAIVTVEDIIAPTVATQNITVQLDTNGMASITTAAIENGSTDNCTISSNSLDISAFTCANLGDNTVTLSVTDQSNNTDTATAIVTVEDVINPVAVAQNITVQLDANGMVTITPAQIENGSTDNCAITNSSLDITSFTCANLGDNTINLTVTDASNNTNTAMTTVTVEDIIAPNVVVQNITVQLDSNGMATITPTQIENGSTDNCTISSSSLDISAFTCASLGDNTVTLSVTDQSNNTGTATAIVTVEDAINPVAVTQNITVQLDANGMANIIPAQIENGSTDNCAITNSSIDITSFTCTDLGDNTINLTVTDASNNSNTAMAIVTVEDIIDPTAIGQDITLDLAGNPSISITATDVDNGSFDNCDYTLSIDINTFTMSGTYPVLLTITDGSNNTSSITVTVTIEDSTLSTEDSIFEIKNVLLYPIPTKDILNIKIPNNTKNGDLKLFDLNGKLVFNKMFKNEVTTLNLSNMQSGVYILKITINNKSISKRIVKTH